MHSLGRSIALLLLAMPLPAVAAPFCVYSEALPPQCIYFDAALLQQTRQATAGPIAR